MTDIVDKTHKLYKAMGANYVGPPVWTWTFPSGSKIRLAYISTDKDIWEYLGPRYSFIGFDESTGFRQTGAAIASPLMTNKAPTTQHDVYFSWDIRSWPPSQVPCT
jgi:hypothetical protein